MDLWWGCDYFCLGSFSGNLLFQSRVALIFWLPIFGTGCLLYMEGSCWGSWSRFEWFVSHVWCHQAGRYVWWWDKAGL